MSKTKIAISGIGAVGGYYGGLLAARYKDSEDIDIYFISRGENLKEIRENGIEVKNTFLTIKAKPTLATDNPAEIGPVDYLFCCTKSYDLEENIAQLTPVIGPNTVIIPLLNGANITERIQQLLPNNEIWKGCVYIGSRLVRPGRVEKFTIKTGCSSVVRKPKQNGRKNCRIYWLTPVSLPQYRIISTWKSGRNSS